MSFNRMVFIFALLVAAATLALFLVLAGWSAFM